LKLLGVLAELREKQTAGSTIEYGKA